MKDALLQAMGTALDGLDIGYCVFDQDDRTLAWNNTFLALFPEHEGQVFVGEPYQANLRRFYAARLGPEELPHIERYIAEGVARHRSQQRPYEFDHQDFRVRVSSIEMGGFGRVRVWRKVAQLPTRVPRPESSTRKLAEHNARAVLERLADGVLIVDLADRGMWANQAFTALYRLPSLAAVVGQSFEDIYRRAWQGEARAAPDAGALQALASRRQYSGAPFELPLPGDRWVRVTERRGSEADGRGYFVHSDITDLKRQARELERAHERLQALATTDALTGLANRRRFDEELALWPAGARSASTRRCRCWRWTWTISSSSTTPWATRWATRCCAGWRPSCGPTPAVRATWPHATAARSSSCCCRAPARPTRCTWPNASASRWRRMPRRACPRPG